MAVYQVKAIIMSTLFLFFYFDYLHLFHSNIMHKNKFDVKLFVIGPRSLSQSFSCSGP